MTREQMIKQIEELNELEDLLTEVKKESEAIKDSIKAEMEMLGTEQLVVDQYVIRYTSVLSNKFDTTAFKKSYNEIYKQFTKQIYSKRFSVTC